MKKRTSFLTYYPMWIHVAWMLGWAVAAVVFRPTSIGPILIWGPALLTAVSTVALIIKIRYDQSSHEVTQTVRVVVKTEHGYEFTTRQSPIRVYHVNDLDLQKGAEIAEGFSLRFRTDMVPDHWNVTYVYA